MAGSENIGPDGAGGVEGHGALASEEAAIKRICIVGTWHQASIVSACFADMGHTVVGVGDNPQEIDSLNAAQPVVREPRLQTIMRRNLRAGRLRYTTDYARALKGADFAYIAIDTPVGADDESDLTSIFAATHQIARAMSRDLIVCVSAQVPVGTCDQIAALIARAHPQHRCAVAYVPEFLRLGTAVENFRRPDRVVIGAQRKTVAEKIAKLYQPLKRPVVLTDVRSAEMAKHASNAFLATSISFINEIASLCDEVGADALAVARILKLDRRIGPHAFLNPGLGFAGGTLGREIRALQKLGQQRRRATPLMDAVFEINATRARLVSDRLLRLYDGPRLDGLTVGILGLTYKVGTSTLRRSMALEIIRDLVAKGAHVKAFDPLANLSEVEDLPSFEVCADPYAAARDADALVLVTEWASFHEMDLRRLQRVMKRPIFIDTRNLFDPTSMREVGFIYSGVGRGVGPEARA